MPHYIAPIFLACLLLGCTHPDHPTMKTTAPTTRDAVWRSHALPNPGLILHVAPDGDDRWTGRSAKPDPQRTDGPLASIDGARDRIRAIRQSDGLPSGGILVAIQPGDYPRTDSLELDAQDSGAPDAPIVYAAASATRGSARILGGRTLTGWRPVVDDAILSRLQPEARGRVVVCDLKSNDIHDYGGLSRRGHGPRQDDQLPLELFDRNRPLDVARWPDLTPWPNNAFAVNTAPPGSTLTCDDAPFARWAGPNPDARAFGYWGSEWSYYSQPVTSIDTGNNRLAIDGRGNTGDRFFVSGVLEALDAPGEYYLDRERGLVYLIPPGKTDALDVSLVAAPLIRLRNVSHVTFERLGIELTRGQGIRIEGGSHVTLAGCIIRNIGTEGVYLDHCTDTVITSCDISDTGDAGVFCDVGDRVNLVPANVTIRNNHFFNIARVAQVYCGAVGGAYGGYIGVTIAHNLIHDINHTAIFFWGNQVRMERNEIYNVVLQSDDAGAVYTGRDLTFQGNTFIGNYLHHTGSSGRHDVYGTMGVYHDDGAGGTLIEDNIFHHVSKPVFAGGGMETVAQNNIFVDCSPAYWIDERIDSRDGLGPMLDGFMRERFNAVGADSEVWTRTYPSMAVAARHYAQGRGIPPYNNAFRRNIVWRSPEKWMISPWVAMPDASILDLRDNLINADPHFVDEAWSDFRLRADSPALPLGFRPIDTRNIGLRRDEYRTHIDRVESRIELIRPMVVTGRGAVGRVRVALRNSGDRRVRGEEFIAARGVVRVEVAGFMDGRPAGQVQAVGGLAIGAGRKSLKAARAGDVSVSGGGRWEFDLEPGQTVQREFDVVVAPGASTNYDMVQIDTRGRIARPARLRAAFEYPLLTAIEPLSFPSADAGTPGSVRISMRNTGSAPAEETLRLTAAPAAWASLSGAEPTLAARAKPGETITATYALTLAPDVPRGASVVEVSVEGLATGRKALRVPITRLVPVLPAQTPLDALAEQLKDGKPYPLIAGDAPFARMRFAIVGDDLAVVADVQDPSPVVTEMLWTGSCIEVFGAADHGHAIGQIFLVPAAGGKPAAGFHQDGTDARLEPSIRVDSRTIDGGYQLTARIPLKLLAITDTTRFVVEAAVTTSDTAGQPGARRATIFGSPKAYADNANYGTMIHPDTPQTP